MSDEETKNNGFKSYITSRKSINGSTKFYMRTFNNNNINNKTSIPIKKEIWIAYLLWIIPISNGLGAFWFYIDAYLKGTISIILSILTILFGWFTWTSLKWEKISNIFVEDGNNYSESIITTSTIIFFIFEIIFIIFGIIWWIFSGVVLQDRIIRYNYEQENKV